MLQNSSRYLNTYTRIVLKFIQLNNQVTSFSEWPLPWEIPGFIGERFLGFFINANKLNKLEVPLIFLQ